MDLGKVKEGTEKEIEGSEEAENSEDKSLPPYYPIHGATSFTEAEEIRIAEEVRSAIKQLNWIFMDLVSNILDDEEIPDKPAAITALVAEYSQRLQAVPQEAPRKGFMKSVREFFGQKEEDPYGLIDEEKARTGPAMKRVNNIDFPARDFAYVPDPQKPSTWKLRLTERPGKVTVRQLGRAAKALSTSGIGKNAAIKSEEISSVKRRIRQEYRKLGVQEAKIPNSVKIDDAQPRQKSGFFVTKDRNGNHRWFSVYSNNYRDDDYPPEIISAASHRTFVKAVEAGRFPMPELWLWHYEHAVGDADWLDFTEGGLALASGTFRKGYEKTAEKLAEMGDLGVSHGMPSEYIVRDQDDPSVIWFHVTKEISPLPAGAAANKLTGFVVMKETEMPISTDKQSFLRETLPEGLFDELNNAVTKAEGAAAKTERESKEATEAPDESTDVDEKGAEEPEFATKIEIAEALGEILAPMLEINNSLVERVASLEATVKELSVAVEVKEAEEAPAATTLASLLAGQLTKSAEVKDTDNVSGPKETVAPENGTGLPFIDQLIAGNRGG